LKDYTIPFVQLESKKSILVFSHNHNSFDKKELLKQMPNQNVHETTIVPKDLVKEPEILKFFMEDIDNLLENYEPGNPDNKPDVKKQLIEMKMERERKAQEMYKKNLEYQETMNKINMINTPEVIQKHIDDQSLLIQQLLFENNNLKEKVDYLNNKIKQIISIQIEKKREETHNLSNN
jgi:hypothetical protein